jgi:hypothetical protein
VSIDSVRRLAADLDVTLAHAADGRARLRELLDLLVSEGVIRFPARQRLDMGKPQLPEFIWVVRERRHPARRHDPTLSGWPLQLAWVTELGLLDDEENDALTRMRSFFTHGGGVLEVPARERSVQIFGDEKRLEALEHTRLFGGSRLSLPLLRCKRIHPPFVSKRVGDGTAVLVLENHTTFNTFAELLDGDDVIGQVAYGAGWQFSASVRHLVDLRRYGIGTAASNLYFGDIDEDGLAIAAEAARVAGDVGVSPLRPATPLYRLLLATGTPQATTPVSGRRATELCEWLEPAEREPVCRLLVQGRRLAQEWVGKEVLTRDDRWREQCAAAALGVARADA